jgi:hypothetical protein
VDTVLFNRRRLVSATLDRARLRATSNGDQDRKPETAITTEDVEAILTSAVGYFPSGQDFLNRLIGIEAGNGNRDLFASACFA